MEKALSVFLHRDLAGTLVCDGNGLSFRYARRWLASPAFFPLSVTLPRSTRRYDHKVVYPYFENLLPESSLRTEIAKFRGIDKTDVFELLEKIAGDCAGAVSLALPGTLPSPDAAYVPLGPRAIKALLAQCDKVPLLTPDARRRATLAGSAQKTTVLLQRGAILGGQDNAPTTHVLKPDSKTLPQSTANEAFCMKLAARAGLPVVTPELLRCGRPLFLIARSDRVVVNGRIRRRHEIDFCQAGNYPSTRKYESDGGPGLARLFSLAAQFVTGWPRARPALISWVIFNYLIGNRDTHAKNLSLTITRDRVKLAPFYDLLSTAIYPGGEKELSLKIGGQARAHAVRREHWRRFARDIATDWPLVERLARDLAAGLPVHARAVIADMGLDRAAKRRVDTIVRLIGAQSRHLQKELGPS